MNFEVKAVPFVINSTSKNQIIQSLLSSDTHSNTRMNTPVMLIPCTHRMEKEFAELNFGKVSNGWKLSEDHQCPQCKCRIEGYVIDETIKKISDIMFKEPTYPGERSNFIHFKGDWSRTRANPCCTISFTDDSNHVFINRFTLWGYENGHVAASLQFDGSKLGAFIKFLKVQNIFLNLNSNEKVLGTYTTKNEKELKEIFYAVISKFCIFPDNYDKAINQIVTKGKIKPIEKLRQPEPTGYPTLFDFLKLKMV